MMKLDKDMSKWADIWRILEKYFDDEGNIVYAKIQDLDRAYAKGEWDMFSLITSAWYGKECYFLEPNGVVYSRETHTYLPDKEAAYQEFIGRIGYE